MTQVGSINRQWDQAQVVYNLCIKFPSSGIDTKRKALILAAGFLLVNYYLFTCYTMFFNLFCNTGIHVLCGNRGM